jgi:ABC-type transporter Mla MlaB component
VKHLPACGRFDHGHRDYAAGAYNRMKRLFNKKMIVANTTYTLSADAGIRDIADVWRSVREQLDAADSILELDAEAVARPDTALAQLLAVAVMRAREQGKSVRIVRASQRLRDMVSLLALDVVLGN